MKIMYQIDYADMWDGKEESITLDHVEARRVDFYIASGDYYVTTIRAYFAPTGKIFDKILCKVLNKLL